jgi:hypothetical protein
VTEQVRSTERIRHLAYHDALTGLPNRRLLTDRLTLAIARAQRYSERVGLLFVDLDDLRINDLGGHAAGDQALLEIADRLRPPARLRHRRAWAAMNSVILLAELDEAGDANGLRRRSSAPCTSPRRPHRLPSGQHQHGATRSRKTRRAPKIHQDRRHLDVPRQAAAGSASKGGTAPIPASPQPRHAARLNQAGSARRTRR